MALMSCKISIRGSCRLCTTYKDKYERIGERECVVKSRD